MSNASGSINNGLRYLTLAFLLVFFLYFGKVLLIPLFYGLFVAVILYPACKWLEKHRFSKTAAISLSLFLLVILFALLIWIIVLQLQAFLKDLPALREKTAPLIIDLQNWLSSTLHISFPQQDSWWQHTADRLMDNPTASLMGSFDKITSALFMLFLIPVFAALFLYNRSDFVLFFERLAGDKFNTSLHIILGKTMNTYFHFIKGMLWVYAIVGVLNSIGLFALGIEHALLFGFLTAVMTIIPYIGIFISALLPVTIAWITKDSIWYPLGVVGVFIFVQYLEANVIFPRVVAAELNVSTWATLVAIIAGGILWGVSGMILFIPMVGILKMITDYIPEWESLNILLRRNKTD